MESGRVQYLSEVYSLPNLVLVQVAPKGARVTVGVNLFGEQVVKKMMFRVHPPLKRRSGPIAKIFCTR